MYKQPLISIIMNCFNGEEFLCEAIDSVINQTYSNWELIFWDNLSTDNSKSIVLSYQDERIKYYKAGKRTNLGEARALAYNKITGEMLTILDCDDIWMQNKLSEQVKYFKQEEVGICYSNTIFFSHKNQMKLYTDDIRINDSTDSLITNYHISLETVMLRVRDLKKLEKAFDPDYSHISDFDLITRLSKVTKIVYVPKTLAMYRIHAQSEGNKKPRLFDIEKLKWAKCNLMNNLFSYEKMALEELLRVIKAKTRMESLFPSYKNVKDLFFNYKIRKNHLFVILSFIPIVGYISIKFRNYLYNKKWLY